MKKKILFNICAVCTVAATLCGCSGSENSFESSSIGTFDKKPQLSLDINPDTPYLSYLGSNVNIRETDAYSLYKETYGKGIEGDLIDVEFVNDREISDKLYERISADRSPDLTDKPEQGIFQSMSKNYYENLSDYIDITSPQWAKYANYVEYYELGGARYFFPETIELCPSFLIYDSEIFEEYEIADPVELINRGMWSWYTFEQSTRQFAEKSRGACGVEGNGIPDAFISSTGVRLFERGEDGKILSNLIDEKIADAMEYMHGMSDILLRETDRVETNLLEERRTAYVLADDDYYNELKNLYPESSLKAVPFPADPKTGAYYVAAEAEGYLVPAGAKNIKGAACFINCGRIAGDGKSNECTDCLENVDIVPNFGEFYCMDSETNELLRNNFADIISDRTRSVSEICEEYSLGIDEGIQKFNVMIG